MPRDGCAYQLLLLFSLIFLLAGCPQKIDERARLITAEINTPGPFATCDSITASGEYTLTANLASPGATCLTIAADDVSINCAGYNISGAGTGNGIEAVGRTNITIRNCNIDNFENGINLSSTNSSTIRNSTATSNTVIGISLYSSSNNTLANNTADSNGGDGGIYLETSNNNTIANNSAFNDETGIFLLSSSGNNITNNSAYSNTYYGVYLWDSNSNNIINNSARNNTDSGIYVGSSASNTIANSSFYNNTLYGILLETATSNTLTNNSAYNNSRNGIYLSYSSNSNNITNNSAYNNTWSGILLNSSNNNTLANNTLHDNIDTGIYLITSSFNTLINNTSFDNDWNGITLETSSNNNTVVNNSLYYNSNDGVYLEGSNISLANNTINSNGYGAEIFSNYTTLTNNSFYNNSAGGMYIAYNNHTTLTSNTISGTSVAAPFAAIYLLDANDTVATNTHLYNNSAYDVYLDYYAVAYTVNFTNLTIDNPTGNFTNYTSLNIYDTVEANTKYSINWTANSSTLPAAANISFAGKFINITNLTGSPSIDYIAFTWLDSELGGYAEGKFGLWKYNASDGWLLLNNTPDTSANTLSFSNFIPSSDYGILDNITILSNCSNLSTAGGYYVLAGNLSSAGTCINVTAHNTTLDCGGFSITGSGTGNGLDGTAKNNTTIKNCILSNFTYGIYFHISNNLTLINNSAYNNTYGIFFSSNNATLTNNSAYNNTQNGIYFYYSNNATLTNNSAYNNTQSGIRLIDSINAILINNSAYSNKHGFHSSRQDRVPENNTFISNSAYNNTQSGIYFESSKNTILINNSAYNNTQSGITLTFSNNSALTNNSAYNTYYGISVIDSNNANLTNNSAYNTQYGIYFYQSSNNAILTSNSAYNNTQSGIRFTSSNNATLTSNSAYNNTQSGIYLIVSHNANLTSNSAYNSAYGIFISASNNATLTSNSAYNNTQSGIHFTSSNNATLTSNSAYNNTLSGIYIQLSNNNTLAGNSIHNNSASGVHFSSSVSNTLDSNSIQNNPVFDIAFDSLSDCSNNLTGNTGFGGAAIGFYNSSAEVASQNFSALILCGADNSSVRNVTVASGTGGNALQIYFTDDSNITDVISHGNYYGVHLLGSNNTRLENLHLYNNSRDFAVNNTGSAALQMLVLNLTVDSPYGNFSNYTALDVNDSIEGSSSYAINWTTNSTALPVQANLSFSQKFVSITQESGTVSIGYLAFRWDDSGGYNESDLQLWKYNSSGWAKLNDTPDATYDILSLANHSPSSLYGILLRNRVPVLHASRTIPTSPQPYLGQSFLIEANVTDGDGDLAWVNFTITAPNGTNVVDNSNGTVSGDLWNSSSVLMDSFGTWNWSILAGDSSGRNHSSSGRIYMMRIVLNLNASTATPSSNLSVSGYAELSNGSVIPDTNIYVYSNGTLQADNISSFASQWVLNATGNNSYAESYGDPGQWDYVNMVGAPDVDDWCTDDANAWASSGDEGEDDAQLNLTFNTSVNATNVSIHETLFDDVTGFVTRIDFEADNGSIYTLWEGTDPTECGGWLNISFNATAAQGKKLIIYTNGSNGRWEEIDAVELSGYYLGTNTYSASSNSSGNFSYNITLPDSDGTYTIRANLTYTFNPTLYAENETNITVAIPPFCGDGTCNGAETCSSCAADCGACPGGATAATSTSGGGRTSPSLLIETTIACAGERGTISVSSSSGASISPFITVLNSSGSILASSSEGTSLAFTAPSPGSYEVVASALGHIETTSSFIAADCAMPRGAVNTTNGTAGANISIACTSDSECAGSEGCSSGRCAPISCDCGEAREHMCFPYQCCSASQCGEGEACSENRCADGEKKAAARQGLRDAFIAIEEARNDNRDTGDAEEILKKATGAFDSARYDDAYAIAQEARKRAAASERRTTPIPLPELNVLAVIALWLALLLFFVLYRRRKRKEAGAEKQAKPEQPDKP